MEEREERGVGTTIIDFSDAASRDASIAFTSLGEASFKLWKEM